MEQLVIRLGSNAEQSIHWLVWSNEQNAIIAAGELPNAAELHSLQSRAGDRPTIALVPGCDVLLKQVTLPAKATRKAVAAIPFMLEDELSTDIDSTFFALGKREENIQNIAIVQKQKIEFWLATMGDAGLPCQQLLPDVLALPEANNSWGLLTLGQHTIVRQSSWQGFQGETNWIHQVIAHYARKRTEKLSVTSYTEVNFANPANTEIIEELSSMPMELLAKVATNTQFNLLQGEFKPKQNISGAGKQWRLAAALAAVATLVTIADSALQIQQLTAHKAQLQAAIHGHFQRAFPETKRIVSVKKQMQQKLRALENNSSGASVLVMLSQLAGPFSSSQVKPQTIRFDQSRSEIRMQAVADNYESIEKFKSLAEQQGFTVEQGAINNRDNKVMGSLIIRS